MSSTSVRLQCRARAFCNCYRAATLMKRVRLSNAADAAANLLTEARRALLAPGLWPFLWHAGGRLVWQAIEPGNRACRRPSNRTTHAVRAYFSGFVSRRHLAAKPWKFVAYREGGLKGRLLDFGHSCGRQSCLQAAFQAAVSDTRRISQASLFDAGRHEAGEIPCCRSSCARLDKLKACPTKTRTPT
jgi:hypothetical protein